MSRLSRYGERAQEALHDARAENRQTRRGRFAGDGIDVNQRGNEAVGVLGDGTFDDQGIV